MLDSRVHSSLIAADNALAIQSERHPDGWGVAYYASGAPHLIRSSNTAIDDALFRRVSAVVRSRTVLAHVRQATRGSVGVLNCHPFQYGRWIFAHNGDVPAFNEVRPALLARVHARLQPHILGDTDSELLFFLFLTYLAEHIPLERRGASAELVRSCLLRVVADVRAEVDERGLGTSLLTFVVTDGEVLLGHKYGRPLFWSTHKKRCSERETCAFLAPACETPTTDGFVNHLIVASEPVGNENIWTPMEDGEVIAIDGFMRASHFPTEAQV